MASVPPTSTFALVDRALGGRARDYLAALRSEGLSYADMAWRLHADHGLKYTGETLRQWCIDLDIATKPTEAAS